MHRHLAHFSAPVLLVGLLSSTPLYAFELEFFDGDLYVDVKTELNYGVAVSTQRASNRYIYGLAAGAHPYSFTAEQATQRQVDNGDPVIPMQDQIITGNGGRNGLATVDDGRLAYHRGVYQNQARGISKLSATWGDFGAIVKLLYYYDTDFVDGVRDTHPGTREEITTSNSVKTALGRDIRTREAFAYWDGYVADVPVIVRLGDQVINWGQSNFSPGISQTNPLDINSLLVPSLARENARTPVGMALVNVGVTDWLNVEAYYQYERGIIGAPPAGTFFAQADVAGLGVGEFSGLGNLCAGTNIDAPYDADPALSEFGVAGACIPLSDAILARNQGQFGLNLGFQLPFIPGLDSFQFNAYYLRHHASIPIIGVRRAGIIPNAVPCNLFRAVLLQSPDAEGRRFGTALTGAGGDPQDPACLNQPTFTQLGWDPNDFMQVGFSFPESQDVFGLSWSGPIAGGFVWAGEIAYRSKTALQISPLELISATSHVALNSNPQSVVDLTAPPFNLVPSPQDTIQFGGDPTAVQTAQSTRESDDLTGNFLQLPRGISCTDIFGADPSRCYTQLQNGRTEPDGYPGGFDGAVGRGISTAGTILDGYVRRDVVQVTTSFLNLYSNVMGADRFIALLELSYMKVIDMPTDLLFATTNVSCTQYLATCVGGADDHGMGYRLLLQWSFSNLLSTKWQLQARALWFHDVKGSVPNNLLLFKEGRRNFVAEFQFKYGQFTTSLRYLGFTGAHDANLLTDRDTLHINFQYSL